MAEEQVLRLEGNITGAGKVDVMLNAAPLVMRSTIFTRLHTERDKFVGNRKGKRGKYTNWLLRKKRKGREGTWGMGAATMFRGFLKGGSLKSGVDAATLTMGLLQKNKSPFVKGMAALDSGFTTTSSKFMTVPVYDNLARLGITEKPFKEWKRMMAADELMPVKMGGRVVYLHRPTYEQGGDFGQAAMFLGLRRIQVKQVRLKFVEKWMAGYPKVLQRMRNAIDRTVRGIDRGKIKLR